MPTLIMDHAEKRNQRRKELNFSPAYSRSQTRFSKNKSFGSSFESLNYSNTREKKMGKIHIGPLGEAIHSPIQEHDEVGEATVKNPAQLSYFSDFKGTSPSGDLNNSKS